MEEGRMPSRKSTFTAVLCTTAIGALGAAPAFAGEVTGNGKRTGAEFHANSVCVFSGHNDAPDNPLDNPDAGGHSQSYGQLNRLGIIESFFHETVKTFNPGDSCRGGSNVPE